MKEDGSVPLFIASDTIFLIRSRSLLCPKVFDSTLVRNTSSTNAYQSRSRDRQTGFELEQNNRMKQEREELFAGVQILQHLLNGSDGLPGAYGIVALYEKVYIDAYLECARKLVMLDRELEPLARPGSDGDLDIASLRRVQEARSIADRYVTTLSNSHATFDENRLCPDLEPVGTLDSERRRVLEALRSLSWRIPPVAESVARQLETQGWNLKPVPPCKRGQESSLISSSPNSGQAHSLGSGDESESIELSSRHSEANGGSRLSGNNGRSTRQSVRSRLSSLRTFFSGSLSGGKSKFAQQTPLRDSAVRKGPGNRGPSNSPVLAEEDKIRNSASDNFPDSPPLSSVNIRPETDSAHQCSFSASGSFSKGSARRTNQSQNRRSASGTLPSAVQQSIEEVLNDTRHPSSSSRGSPSEPISGNPKRRPKRIGGSAPLPPCRGPPPDRPLPPLPTSPTSSPSSRSSEKSPASSRLDGFSSGIEDPEDTTSSLRFPPTPTSFSFQVGSGASEPGSPAMFTGESGSRHAWHMSPDMADEVYNAAVTTFGTR